VRNFLLDAKHKADALMAKHQGGSLASFVGKQVLRAGRLLDVLSASRKKGVTYTVVATGQKTTVSRDAFLSRKIQIVEVSSDMRKSVEADMLTRAYDIASASEVSARVRIQRLQALARDAAGDEEALEAIGYYIAKLKAGETPKKWSKKKK